MPNVKIRLAVGGSIDGYDDYEAALARYPAEPLAEELEGTRMLYSSGTTGRPKGVAYKMTRQLIGEQPPEMGMITLIWGMDEESVYLSPAPLYHSAPLFYCLSTTRLGGTAIIMEQFDPEGALAAIEKYKVTHSQWVPTMFVRMLKLPDDVRTKYDTSSQKVVIHAAAPCSVETKRKMIEWWGPIIDEYYAATEGTGGTYINSADWLAHPVRSARRCSGRSTSSTRTAPSFRPARSAPCGSSRCRHVPASSTTRTRTRRATRSTTRDGRPSATWATSTTTASCSSPTGARS